MSETDAWAAGYIDADGSVTLHYSPSRALSGTAGRAFRFQIQASSVNRESLERLHEQYGGWLSSIRDTAAGRPAWSWGCRGRRAVDVARRLLPYATVKRERMRLFIEAWDSKVLVPTGRIGPGAGRGGHHCLSDETIEMLARASQAIASLNQKGMRPRHMPPKGPADKELVVRKARVWEVVQ